MTKNIALGIASTTIALLVLAGVFETYKSYRYDRWHAAYVRNRNWIDTITIASPNPTLLWEYRPRSESRRLKLETNEFGFRQHREVSLRRDDKDRRAAFIGDSVTVGMTVEVEETFVAILENLDENAPSPTHLETLNFGVDGYHTIQIQELLVTKVLEFSPDIVVYTMCVNDFDFEDSSGGKALYFRKPDSFLLNTLREVRKRLLFAGEDFHLFYFEENKDVVFRTVAQMNETLRGRGIEFYVVVVPAFQLSTVTASGVKVRDMVSFSEYPLAGMHEEIARALGEIGVHTIDLLDLFARQSEPPAFYAADVWHPNPQGHRLIAEFLAGVLSPDEG